MSGDVLYVRFGHVRLVSLAGIAVIPRKRPAGQGRDMRDADGRGTLSG